MNEMAIIGNVVDEPRLRVTTNGHKVTTFRVASTQRRFDREQDKFVDGSTLYMNVTSWRGAAENVFASLHKGQPVLVYGRCSTRNYVVNEQPRTSYELEAFGIGHDLFRGVSTFDRVYRDTSVTVEADGTGMPVDDSDHYLSVAGGESRIDPMTGEVYEDDDEASVDSEPVLVGS
ncbi:single-stranded DNA-binding protein [uncultured Jatrophihabitans sp.]|uniref:single-stranded DNA-binding protein n=1 Tax=uncultured Jatrophihabitans sp. TaxID=1610747 RepID=UPI0035C97345